MGEIGYEGRKGRDATGDSLFSGVHFGGGHGGHDMKVGASVLIIDFSRSQSTVLHKNILCKVDFDIPGSALTLQVT